LILSLRIKFADKVGTRFFFVFEHNYDVPIGWSQIEDYEEEKATNEPLVKETTSSV
jgi:hypothetical protein